MRIFGGSCGAYALLTYGHFTRSTYIRSVIPIGVLSDSRVESSRPASLRGAGAHPLLILHFFVAAASGQTYLLNSTIQTVFADTYMNKLELPIALAIEQRLRWNLLSCSLCRIPRTGVAWD